MAYKCERRIIYDGEEITIGQCETCKYEKLASAEEPCFVCGNGASDCPLYGQDLNEKACANCKWEEIGSVDDDKKSKICLTEDCPFQDGNPCAAAETCGGFEGE